MSHPSPLKRVSLDTWAVLLALAAALLVVAAAAVAAVVRCG